jgi:hypothetical protein
MCKIRNLELGLIVFTNGRIYIFLRIVYIYLNKMYYGINNIMSEVIYHVIKTTHMLYDTFTFQCYKTISEYFYFVIEFLHVHGLVCYIQIKTLLVLFLAHPYHVNYTSPLMTQFCTLGRRGGGIVSCTIINLLI